MCSSGSLDRLCLFVLFCVWVGWLAHLLFGWLSCGLNDWLVAFLMCVSCFGVVG